MIDFQSDVKLDGMDTCYKGLLASQKLLAAAARAVDDQAVLICTLLQKDP